MTMTEFESWEEGTYVARRPTAKTPVTPSAILSSTTPHLRTYRKEGRPSNKHRCQNSRHPQLDGKIPTGCYDTIDMQTLETVSPIVITSPLRKIFVMLHLHGWCH